MEIINRSEAKALGLTHYFTGKPCKHGHVEKRRVNDRVCMQCDLEYQIRVYKENPEKARQRRLKTYERTKEKHLAQKRVYRQANKAKVNALAKAYKVRKKNRVPKWVDKDHMWLIKEAYELAQLRTKLFGFPWHVDHKAPIQGELVSGLHVIENLQVIPAIENIKKKNKFEVDYANQVR
jgi:hypothetical protein